jgi:hypothetical protein
MFVLGGKKTIDKIHGDRLPSLGGNCERLIQHKHVVCMFSLIVMSKYIDAIFHLFMHGRKK